MLSKSSFRSDSKARLLFKEISHSFLLMALCAILKAVFFDNPQILPIRPTELQTNYERN